MEMLFQFFIGKAYAYSYDIGIPTSPLAESTKGTSVAGMITSLGGSLLTEVLLLAGVLAVIFIIWSGIMYITSGGNAEKAKTARNGVINGVIGIIIVVSAYSIINIAMSIGNKIK